LFGQLLILFRQLLVLFLKLFHTLQKALFANLSRIPGDQRHREKGESSGNDERTLSHDRQPQRSIEHLMTETAKWLPNPHIGAQVDECGWLHLGGPSQGGVLRMVLVFRRSNVHHSAKATPM